METTMLVRATINLHRLSVGRVVRVDPGDPYIRDCLAQGYLVPVNTPGVQPEPQAVEAAGAEEETA